MIDPAHPKHGDRVSEVVTDLLWAGVYPFWSVVDRGRDVIANTGCGSVREGLLALVDGIPLSPWQERVPTPFLIVESDSLAGVIEQIAHEYRTPLAPLRGQGSTGICFDTTELSLSRLPLRANENSVARGVSRMEEDPTSVTLRRRAGVHRQSP